MLIYYHQFFVNFKVKTTGYVRNLSTLQFPKKYIKRKKFRLPLPQSLTAFLTQYFLIITSQARFLGNIFTVSHHFILSYSFCDVTKYIFYCYVTLLNFYDVTSIFILSSYFFCLKFGAQFVQQFFCFSSQLVGTQVVHDWVQTLA